MVRIIVDEKCTEVESEEQVIEITAEMIEGTTHMIKNLLDGQSDDLKRFHIDMYCEVLKNSLERTIL